MAAETPTNLAPPTRALLPGKEGDTHVSLADLRADLDRFVAKLDAAITARRAMLRSAVKHQDAA